MTKRTFPNYHINVGPERVDFMHFQIDWDEKADGKQPDGTMEITAFASTKDLDSGKDIVEVGAFTDSVLKEFMTNPLFLFNHAFFDEPIGVITDVERRAKGLWFRALISSQELKKQELIRLGGLSQFSIAFTTAKSEELDDDGRRITELKRLFEISLVNMAMNKNALLESFKSAFSIPTNKRTNLMQFDEAKINKILEQATSASEKADENLAAAAKAQEEINKLSADFKAKMTDVQKGLFTQADADLFMEKMSGDLTDLSKLVNGSIGAKRQAESIIPFAEFRIDEIHPETNTKFGWYLVESVDYRKEKDGDLLRRFHDYHDAIVICNTIKMNSNQHRGYRGPQDLKFFETYKRLAGLLNPELEEAIEKAISSTVAGSGLEWGWTFFSANVIDRYRLAQQIGGLYEEINLPADPFVNPATGTKPRVFAINEATTNNPDLIKKTQSGTRKITWTTSKFGAAIPVSAEAIEDSIFAILPKFRNDFAFAIAESEDSVLLNGDDSATHLDNGGSADKFDEGDPEREFKGLRKIARLNSATKDFVNVKVTETLLDDVFENMGKTGTRVSELAVICGIKVYFQILRLPTATDASKFGAASTYLSGFLNAWRGSPLIISDQVLDDLNASGVFDNSVTDRTSLHVINRRGFIKGMRRMFSIETQNNALTDQVTIVGTRRFTWEEVFFSPRIDATNGDEQSVSEGFNIAT